MENMFEKYKSSEVPKIIEVGYVKLDYILENYQKLKNELKINFEKELLESFVPLKIKFDKISYSYRYKNS